jgi:ATP/maltotriose-dependent transcriptional regulator MalT
MIANASYDKARYELSIISSEVPSSSLAPGEINALALISLAELAFLSGEYKKARTLSEAVNDLLSKKLPGSYPYSVSQVLTVKSYFDSRNISLASKKLELIRREKTDKILYSALDPWL